MRFSVALGTKMHMLREKMGVDALLLCLQPHRAK